MTEDHPEKDGASMQPQPMRKRPAWHTALRGAGILIAGAGTFFAIAWASMPRLSGATRSAKLKFDQRQQEVDQAVQREDSQGAGKATASDISGSATTSR